MGFNISVTKLGNAVTVAPRDGGNIVVAQTGTQVSINTNATLIQTISMASTYKGAWASGTTYKRGDTVKYAGNVWLSQNDFTSTVVPTTDTTNWTLFSSSETTSTYNTVTALTSIVAAPSATLAFKRSNGIDSSNVLLSTATTAINFPDGIETTTLRASQGVTVVGDITGKRATFNDPAYGQYSTIYIQPGVELSARDTKIRAFSTLTNTELVVDIYKNIFDTYTSRIKSNTGNLEINSPAGISIVADGSHYVNIAGQYLLSTEIRTDGLTARDGIWIGYNQGTGTKIVDSSGNWVGPAISSSNPFDQTCNTTSSVTFNLVSSNSHVFQNSTSTGFFSNAGGTIQFKNSNTETATAGSSGWEFKQTTKLTGTNLNDVAFNQTRSFSSISGTSQQELDSWAVSTYSTVKYLIQIKDGSSIQIEEIILAYDGTDVHISKYGIITNNGELGTFTADKTAGAGANVRLLFTPGGASNMSVKIHKTLMAV
jgi:hypothetical protein